MWLSNPDDLDWNESSWMVLLNRNAPSENQKNPSLQSGAQSACCPDSQKTFTVEGHMGCGVYCTPPPNRTHPSFPFPRDFTCLLRSSIIRVIWIFFLPIVPVSFFSPPFQELYAFLLSSFLHSPALPVSVSFSSICSNQLKDSSIRTCKKEEGRARRVGWALNEMKYGKIRREKK